MKDLPLAEQVFVIRPAVRRFICGSADCRRRTFAEPFSQLAAPYARFTTRLNRSLERVGLALAGRAGARLTAQLGFGAGRMTLLRSVMALPDPRFSTPRVLGVGDFAIRRGQTCSTVLTSVEDHQVVDVLPTREAGPLAAWLIRHPGVEIICRDRAGAYAEGARSRRPRHSAGRRPVPPVAGPRPSRGDLCRRPPRLLAQPVARRFPRDVVAGHPTSFRSVAGRLGARRPAGRAEEGSARPGPRDACPGPLTPGYRPASGLGPQHRAPVRESRPLAGHHPREPTHRATRAPVRSSAPVGAHRPHRMRRRCAPARCAGAVTGARRLRSAQRGPAPPPHRAAPAEPGRRPSARRRGHGRRSARRCGRSPARQPRERAWPTRGSPSGR
ncbi:hypothetical protein [Streptomyces sp. NPDC014995]|uniref:hypothetical protein n=1 Tax=Streptomyces sp. NPDC014995 TaxID=3364936 RepID=UPI0036FF7076